jgi:[ribosomal protein S5]-alanine N-acetyltransferase
MNPLNLSEFPILETPRLVLKQLALSDDKAILALRSDDFINQFLGRAPAKTIKDAQDFIIKINESIANNNSFYWAIKLKNTDDLIGTICLYNIELNESKVEIGYELLRGYHGQGFMQEAVSEVVKFAFQLGFETIMAYSSVENKASMRLLERTHFKLSPFEENQNEWLYILSKEK